MKSISRTIDEIITEQTSINDETVYIQMTCSEWEKKYKPSDMLDTHDDFKEVINANPLTVWTELHASGSFEGIESGLMYCDRLGYYITEVPRNKNEVITIDYHAECDDEYAYPDCCEKDCAVCEDRFDDNFVTKVKDVFVCNNCKVELNRKS